MIPFLIALLAAPPPQQTPTEVFAGLVGSCYRGTLADKGSETHCFIVTDGGQIVRDTHTTQAANGTTTARGITVYAADAQSGWLSSLDTGSFGMVFTAGFAWREHFAGYRDQISFSPSRFIAGLPPCWQLGDDGFDTRDGRPSVHFQRIGPTSENGKSF